MDISDIHEEGDETADIHHEEADFRLIGFEPLEDRLVLWLKGDERDEDDSHDRIEQQGCHTGDVQFEVLRLGE